MPPSAHDSPRKTWRQRLAARVGPAMPDYWIQLKIVVLVVLGLAVWCFYVVVGRVCAPAIQHKPGRGVDRGAGIGVLVAFVILWLMFMWCYLAIVLTPPGYAQDAVPEAAEFPSKQQPGTFMTDKRAPMGNDCSIPNPTDPFMMTKEATEMSDSSAGPSPTSTQGPHRSEMASPHPTASPPMATPSEEAVTFAFPPPPPGGLAVPRPVPRINTMPRWCPYCKIIKPDRTHHCRHCGTCVLQFDHHCPWIGQCVGWRNHAIFMTFNFWAGAFCTFDLVVLIVDQSMSNYLDGQKIALAIVCALFILFTLFAMLPTHINLILTGKSTVESFASDTQKRAEQAVLDREFKGMCSLMDKRTVRRRWEDEYGGVAINDRWAFGRKRDLWKQEMGPSWLGWIFPIGRPLGDGVHFPANPRFGPNGEWLPRSEWPKVIAV